MRISKCCLIKTQNGEFDSTDDDEDDESADESYREPSAEDSKQRKTSGILKLVTKSQSMTNELLQSQRKIKSPTKKKSDLSQEKALDLNKPVLDSLRSNWADGIDLHVLSFHPIKYS